MRALVQRVGNAEVRVQGERVGAIESGLLVLLGVRRGDEAAQVERLAHKVARLRVFPDEQGRFDRSLLDGGGGALVVSQFTLYGDASRGHRPSFTEAAEPPVAEPLYEAFCEALAASGVEPVERGRFGAAMAISLVADGPVTILLEA